MEASVEGGRGVDQSLLERVCVCVHAAVLMTSQGALLCLSASSLIHY